MTRLEHHDAGRDEEAGPSSQRVSAELWAAWKGKRRVTDARVQRGATVVFGLLGAGAIALVTWAVIR